MMPRSSSSSSTFVALLAAAMGTTTLACTIPTTPLPNTIAEQFSIVVQNPAIPIVHNRIMNFRANGDDEHLVLRPEGVVTGDTLYLDNGLLRVRNIHAVIDLEYNDKDDTTKMFMTERLYHPNAVFQPVYGCDPDTDELQIRLQLVSRQTDPPVLGGQIGIRETVGTYEFRYTPPNNPLLDDKFLPVNMVIFRDGNNPTATASISTKTTTTSTSVPPTSTTKPPTTTTTTTKPPTTTTTPTTLTTLTTTTTSPNPTNTATLPPVAGYTYVSCYSEPPNGRALPVASLSTNDMTLAKCASFCSTFPYFGTEWSQECWCASTLTPGSLPAPESSCDHPCAGDPSKICGGSRILSLYHNPSILGPAHPQTVGAYNLVGCVTDSQGVRTLNGDLKRSDDTTLESCAAFCGAAGYQYFGAEWSVECWCGNALAPAATQVDLAECSMRCGGNAGEYCGNGDRLSLYKRAA